MDWNPMWKSQEKIVIRNYVKQSDLTLYVAARVSPVEFNTYYTNAHVNHNFDENVNQIVKSKCQKLGKSLNWNFSYLS